MQYRKQKQWIEFILRLLPFLMLLLYVIAHIFAFQKTGNLSSLFSDGLLSFISSTIDFFVSDIFNIADIVGLGNLFDSFYQWVNTNISDNIFTNFVISILVYETLLSLIFLLFDFINFIIEFARKWLGGLYGKEN